MPDGSQTVRKGRKFDQVVEGARHVFLTDGFERASVDDIAKAASVSKATLYSYFPDKRFLFVEVMKSECQLMADQAISDIDFSQDPRTVLTQVCRTLVDVFLSDFGLQMFKVSVAESGNFDGLGEAFYASGPGLISNIMGCYFEMAESRGELRIDDKELAAHQLCELCKSWAFPRKCMHIQEEFTEVDRDRVAIGAVDIFLARYSA